MGSDMGRSAKDYLNSAAGAKLAGKQAELEKLAESKDGQKVRNMLQNSGVDLAGAIEKGDTSALRLALESILRTEEGGRVVSELTKMME